MGAEELGRETGEEQTAVGRTLRMADDRLPKRAAELCEQGRMRRGRPRLRMEDCAKREVKKAGEEGDWKNKTRYRGGEEVAVSTSPQTKGQRGRRDIQLLLLISYTHNFLLEVPT